MLDLQYHPGKTNVVADALSRKNQGIAASVALKKWKTYVTVGEFDWQFCQDGDKTYACNIVATPSFQQVKQGQ